jgi:thioesterase domain-containing protein
MNAAAIMASAAGLEDYLHQAIPLSRSMHVTVVEVTEERAVLSAPLAPNVNHLGIVFGGSACTLATLSAWSLLHCRLQSLLPAVSLVLQGSSMQYLRPISSSFSAQAQLAPDANWELFLRTLRRRGRARISATAQLLAGEQLAGHFAGEFVALAAAPKQAR